ncbi:molybdopterin molybdenumtransferase MoeA [Clostridium sp. MCC353]|uniref:molybdopterin molybdotransferase MoeA n=1 Tax=Clostridium sp. MCC353 TaxID=2592646 RepID=UPI001C028FB9|nr:gephyrin-like molybdotransferase Glp [Clostridium sp. MCC353]MBT9777312.1 molybdopterin molybdenumtransferase MoeA [Clostridium sp. MCC353]
MERATIEEVMQMMLKEIPHGIAEELSLLDALGCELAEDLLSPVDQPPFPRSPLDGYAVRAEDLKGASEECPAVLTVIDEVMAGGYSNAVLKEKTAVRIMTGAPVPAGADCIVRQEDTDYGEDEVSIYVEHRAFENYCFQGEDFKKGDCLVEKGTPLDSIAIGIAASMGRDKVLAYRKPKVAVFATGDELVEPGQPLLPGKIYNSNLYVLVSRLMELGIRPVMMQAVEDNETVMGEKIKTAASKADLIITTGGVSVGKKDIMHGALEGIGARRLFWGIRMKPGMPTLCSVYENTLVISLSGNPFGAVANMEVLVRPVLARLSHQDALIPKVEEGIMEDAFLKESRVRRMVRGVIADGKVTLPKGLHSSGVLGSMMGCNCLIDVPAGTKKLEPGDRVSVILC